MAHLSRELFLMFSRRVKYLVIFRNGVSGIEKRNSVGVNPFVLPVF